jgi:hypothetical protein
MLAIPKEHTSATLDFDCTEATKTEHQQCTFVGAASQLSFTCRYSS